MRSFWYPNLRAFGDYHPLIMETAKESWEEGNIVGVFEMMSNERSMGFIVDNWHIMSHFSLTVKLLCCEPNLKHSKNYFHTYLTILLHLCNVVFLVFQIHTTFQLETIKK